jgi:hypothetical protein
LSGDSRYIGPLLRCERLGASWTTAAPSLDRDLILATQILFVFDGTSRDIDD